MRCFPSRRATGKEAEGKKKGGGDKGTVPSLGHNFSNHKDIGLEGWAVWGALKSTG